MTTTDTTKPAKRIRKTARVAPVGTPVLPTEPYQAAGKGEEARSKTALVLELLQQPAGGCLDELVAATGWLPHTTRAALTGLRKKGHAIVSEKVDGARRYRVVNASETGAAQ